MSTETIRTTCSYCSVGCNLDVTVTDGVPGKLMPNQEYPVNLGKSCPKGFHLLKPFVAEDRATAPLMRNGNGELEPVDWDTALDTFVSRFKDVPAKHGPEAGAFLSTGQIPMEEMAFLGALGKFGMGMVHGDGKTRRCMATAAVAYKQASGFDAPPFTYKDFEESDLLIFVGANPTISHPIMWNRVQMNKKDRKIVVLDPRRTKTAAAADTHLPVYPKSDLTVLYAVANELIRRDWIDHDFVDAHTEGFDELAANVAEFTLERAAGEAAERQENRTDVAAMSSGGLVDHIVTTCHDALRRELPRPHETVDEVADGHGDEDPRLLALRDIYVAFEGASTTTRATLAALEELERGMHRHVHTEYDVLVPRFCVTSKCD